MKNTEKIRLAARISNTFELPRDVLENETLIHMTGGKDLYLENYKGLLAYSCSEIVVKGYYCKIVICGKCLSITYYSDEDMKITGNIQEVKIIK